MHFNSLLIVFFVNVLPFHLGLFSFAWRILFSVYVLCCWLVMLFVRFFFFVWQNVTILSLLLKGIFANSRILDHELTFFQSVRDPVHCVLASSISVEKMAISIIVAPLIVMCFYTTPTFKMFTLSLLISF